ncbi:hypothetical protein SAMN05428976_11156 [Clostridium sp. USBA 49]|nr:hypothetical protein [Acetivibrio thermocellus]THJ76572.1 hypothetical protein EPD62_15850 [Acetivibrio thermocellus]SKA88433.1 hypothetical protein SAMN05428976_11156 [Clostridium sp. USBA 49]
MYATYENGRIVIYDAYLYREVIKEIQERYWDPVRKVWIVPFNAESVSTLRIIGCEFKGVLIDMVSSLIENNDKLELPVEAIEPMPIKVKPYQHQVQAYNFIGNLLGFFTAGGST